MRGLLFVLGRRIGWCTRGKSRTLRRPLLHALLEIWRVHSVGVLIIAIVGVKLGVVAKLPSMRLQLLLKVTIRWLQIRHSLAHLHIRHMRRTVGTWSAILHVGRVWIHRLALKLMRHTTTALTIHGSEVALTRCEGLLLSIVLIVVAVRSTTPPTLRHIEVLSRLSVWHCRSANFRM